MKHKTLKEAMKAAKETGKRQQVEAQPGPHEVKVNVSMRLDLEVLNWLKAEAEKRGLPYTTLANSLLKQASTSDSFEERLARLEKAVLKGKVG
ncbi:BrnA antitoxin family protein [Bdellovibrio bacteriovorus]|uniref:BrnA antitoxin family protein n=1 Tax=Bdellovibrio TaxID=958 RepID=UPI0035A91216